MGHTSMLATYAPARNMPVGTVAPGLAVKLFPQPQLLRRAFLFQLNSAGGASPPVDGRPGSFQIAGGGDRLSMTAAPISSVKRFSAAISSREMRQLCMARNLAYYGGVASTDWLATTDQVRRDYIDRVGLRQYLAEMLPARISQLPADQGVAYLPNGQAVAGGPAQRIIDFLAELTPLPYRLDVRRRHNGKIEELTFSL